MTPIERAPARDEYWHEVRAWVFMFALCCIVIAMIAGLAWRFLSASGSRVAPAVAKPAPAFGTDLDCIAPLHPGETLQVVFRHEGGRITFRCQLLTDWHALRKVIPKGDPQ